MVIRAGGEWPGDTCWCWECNFSVNLSYLCPPKLQLLSKTPAPPQLYSKTFPGWQLVVLYTPGALSLLSRFINSWEAVCFIRLTLDTKGSLQIYMLTKDLVLASMVDTLSGMTPLFLSGPLPWVLLPACLPACLWSDAQSLDRGLRTYSCFGLMSIKKGRAAKVGLHEVSGKEQMSRAFEERGSPASTFNYGRQTWKVRLFYGAVMTFTVRASAKCLFPYMQLSWSEGA